MYHLRKLTAVTLSDEVHCGMRTLKTWLSKIERCLWLLRAGSCGCCEHIRVVVVSRFLWTHHAPDSGYWPSGPTCGGVGRKAGLLNSRHSRSGLSPPSVTQLGALWLRLYTLWPQVATCGLCNHRPLRLPFGSFSSIATRRSALTIVVSSALHATLTPPKRLAPTQDSVT